LGAGLKIQPELGCGVYDDDDDDMSLELARMRNVVK
jgi:hypothetical protein